MPISKEEARRELAIRELSRRKQNGQGQQEKNQSSLDPVQELIRTNQLSKEERTKEFGTLVQPPLADRIAGQLQHKTLPDISEKLPDVAQFIGSVGGGVAGTVSPVKAPIRGAIAGGTIMRGVGEAAQEYIDIKLNSLKQGRQDLTSAEKKRIGSEALKASGKALIAESLTAGAGAGVRTIGKGMLSSLLGKRVAERGLEKGFKNLLDPKFFKNGLDKTIVKKTGNFFDKLVGVTGKGVQKSIGEQKEVLIDTKALVSQASKLLRTEGADTIDDIFHAGVPESQRKLVKTVQKMFTSLGNKEKLNIPALWKTRKNMDKIIFRKKWDPDVEDYLMRLRGVLNKPIVSSSDDVAKSFARYEGVRQQQKRIGNLFDVEQLDGKQFGVKVEESLLPKLLKTGKDETASLLKELDSFLPVEDRVIEDLLDSAAAETFENDIQLMGLFSRAIIGAAGGKKSIAGIPATLQKPVIKGSRNILGSLISAGAVSPGQNNLQREQ